MPSLVFLKSPLDGLDGRVVPEAVRPALDLCASPRAFERAIAPELPRLYRFCLSLAGSRAEADDLLQEGLVRAWQSASSFAGRSELFGWLCGILRNHHLEVRRTAARRRSLFDRVLSGTSAVLGSIFTGGTEAPDPESEAARSEGVDRLLRALAEVPEPFRLVVHLCDVEELGYDEAARILGLPVGTVKSRHARGRKRLVKAYRALYGAEGESDVDEA